jgi:hypothetical protein
MFRLEEQESKWKARSRSSPREVRRKNRNRDDRFFLEEE